MKYILCLLLFSASCSYKKSNQVIKGHEELYSEPSEPDLMDVSDDEKRIIIASTNDLHGHLNPLRLTFKDVINPEPQSIFIGGQEVIGHYFKILRDVYKNVVLLDSGNLFSSGAELSEVTNFYQKNKYDAVTVGLRDFNIKVPLQIGTTTNLFKDFAKLSHVPLLLSNLYELKTARGVEWEGTTPHLIKEVDGVKIGIIGLIPDDIVTQTPVNNRVGLYVENMLQSTLRHSRLLKSLGADVIVVLTHPGIDCNTGTSSEAKLPVLKVNFDPAKENICDLKNPLGEYLQRLPRGLVDVVIGGRNGQKTANYINGVLVMAGLPDGKSFSYAELVINLKTRKLNPAKTIAHQPVFFCHEFFHETHDCFSEDESVDHKKRMSAEFLGQKIPSENLTARLDLPAPSHDEISKHMSDFKADISFVQKSSGQTQLLMVKLTGRMLAKILEEDYNHGLEAHWWPSPFIIENNQLFITLSGGELDLQKTYRILTDLESAQAHRFLAGTIVSSESEILMNFSWLPYNTDVVSTGLAAQAR